MVRLTKWSMGSAGGKIVRRWPLSRPVPVTMSYAGYDGWSCAAARVSKDRPFRWIIGRAMAVSISSTFSGECDEVTFSVPSSVKSRGYFAMWQKLLKCCRETKARKVRIEHDNGVFEDQHPEHWLALTFNSIAGFWYAQMCSIDGNYLDYSQNC